MRGNISAVQNAEKERGKAACLVDIRDVHVDASLSKFERIREYIRQIKDPYHFRCGEFTVTVKYADNGVTIEDCLERIVT